jgi:class 3 adenylate cyclase
MPPSAILPSLPGIVIANLMGMLASYTLEHWSRRDFALGRLLEQEREKSERLLRNVLPEAIADRLKERPETVADNFDDVTVLFADLVDFTPLTARLSAADTVRLLNEVFSCFDALAEKHRLEKIKTIGDAYMVVGGLPEPREDHAEAVMAMAIDMQRETARFRSEAGEPLALRIGISTGPVVAGVIGTKKFAYDLWGDTVNLASRMETHGVPGGIQITLATYERLRDRYSFTARPLHHVKGKGELTAYVLDAQPQSSALR